MSKDSLQEDPFDLKRFLKAQKHSYQRAYDEIKNGKKQSCWMWYIFPQLDGLGSSYSAEYYGIKSIKEAIAYINHPILGKRLIDICNALKPHSDKTSRSIFGYPDDLKLCSCLTLFAGLPNADPIFQELIDIFCKGKACEFTSKKLAHERLLSSSPKTHANEEEEEEENEK